jgi:hypothetical protein
MTPEQAQKRDYVGEYITQIYVRFAIEAMQHIELYDAFEIESCISHLERHGEHEVAEMLREKVRS